MKTKEKRITTASQQLPAFETSRVPEHKALVRFDVLTVQWLKNVKLRIKESSYVKYYNMVQNHIVPELGTYRMDELTTEIVEQFVQKKLTSG